MKSVTKTNKRIDENQKKRRHLPITNYKEQKTKLPFTKDRRPSVNRNLNLEKKMKSVTKINKKTEENQKKEDTY